jgi:hypothetical protein
VNFGDRTTTTIEVLKCDLTNPKNGDAWRDEDGSFHRITKILRTDITWRFEDCEVSDPVPVVIE